MGADIRAIRRSPSKDTSASSHHLLRESHVYILCGCHSFFSVQRVEYLSDNKTIHQGEKISSDNGRTVPVNYRFIR